jgi:hypothetical protein
MTEYWFGFYKGEPRVLYRMVSGGNSKGERYDNNENEWVPDSTISWYLVSGELGYEETTEEAAQQFIQSKLA